MEPHAIVSAHDPIKMCYALISSNEIVQFSPVTIETERREIHFSKIDNV